jgi:DNA-binding MarR family transcriptional regulator
MQSFNNHSLFLLSINRFCYDVGRVISGKYKLTVNERNTLIVLFNLSINSITELSGYLSISKTNTSKVLSSLEKKNLLVRIIDKDDKRQIQLLLTEKGKQVSENVIDEISNLFNKRLNEMPNEIREKILNLMVNYPQITVQSSIKLNNQRRS